MKRKYCIVFCTVILIGLAAAVIVQAFSIHKLKKEQEDQFRFCLATAVQSFEEYKETGYEFMYEHALFNLHSAASVATLMLDDDEYEGMHGVLLSLCGAHFSAPEDFLLFTDEIVKVLKDFEKHQNVENLYIKLNMIDNKLTAMLFERAVKVE